MAASSMVPKKAVIKISKQDSLVIKGVAILLMIVHHLLARNDLAFSSLFFSAGQLAKIGQFGKLCVPMFVFVTGYAASLPSSSSSLSSRLFRLWMKYLPFFLVGVTVKFLILHEEPGAYLNPVMWVASLLGVTKLLDGTVIGIYGVWWYMTTAYLLCILSFLMQKHLRRSFSTAWTLFTLSLFLPSILQIPYSSTSILLPWLPAFLFGYALGCSRVRWSVSKPLLSGLISGVLAVALYTMLHKYRYDYLAVILPLPLTLLAVYELTAGVSNRYLPSKRGTSSEQHSFSGCLSSNWRVFLSQCPTRLLSWLGSHSLGMYLSHTAVMALFLPLLSSLCACNWLLGACMVAALSLGVDALVCQICALLKECFS